MALRFCDGFDHYATADFDKKWTSNVTSAFAGSSTITVGAFGRNSTNGIRFDLNDAGAGLRLQKTVTTSGSTAIVGTAFKFSALNGTNTSNAFISIWDGATIQCCLRPNSDGTLSVLRGNNNGTVLGTSATALSAATYYYVEFKVVLHTSAGTYDVKVNNTSVLSGSGANTANAATTSWTAFRLGADGTNSTGGALDWDYDDVYACDGSGATNNDFLGPIRVKAIFADGNGTTNNFTPSAGSNFQNVDEAAQDGDTTYNSETSPGDIDLYTTTALGLTGAVRGVQTNLIVRSDGAGSETIAPMWRLSSTNYQGTTVGVSTTYTDALQIYETSPDTATAWTVSELDGAEFGIKLVS